MFFYVIFELFASRVQRQGFSTRVRGWVPYLRLLGGRYETSGDPRTVWGGALVLGGYFAGNPAFYQKVDIPTDYYDLSIGID